MVAGDAVPDDAVVVRSPSGEYMIQTLDFFTPLCDDPYLFGQIAAANSLSDVYAMGGTPYTAMNICCFPMTAGLEILSQILAGGAEMPSRNLVWRSPASSSPSTSPPKTERSPANFWS